LSGIDEQVLIPNCPLCEEPPHNWHIKTIRGSNNSLRGIDIWIFPEKRLAKELLDSASRIRYPVQMIPIPHTKEDLVGMLNNISEVVCTTCHKYYESDKVLVKRLKRVLIKAYEEAGDKSSLKLGI